MILNPFLMLCQAPSVGSGEPSLPGAVEQQQPLFLSRFLEGQSGVTIKSVSCGDLFTTCMTGRYSHCVRHAQQKWIVVDAPFIDVE